MARRRLADRFNAAEPCRDLPQPPVPYLGCNKAARSEHQHVCALGTWSRACLERCCWVLGRRPLLGVERRRLSDCFNAAEPRRDLPTSSLILDAKRLSSMSIKTSAYWGSGAEYAFSAAAGFSAFRLAAHLFVRVKLALRGFLISCLGVCRLVKCAARGDTRVR